MRVIVANSCVIKEEKTIRDYTDDELIDMIDGLDVREMDLETFQNEFNKMEVNTNEDYIRFIKDEG